MKTLGQKLTPILIEVEDTIWEHQADSPNERLDFDDGALRAASKIFMTALFDEMWKLQEVERMPIDDRYKMATHAGEQLRKLILEMTNIDSHNFYS